MRNLEYLIPTPDPEHTEWTWATVTQAAPLRVRFDTEALPLPVTPQTLAGGLIVGDRVWCQVEGRRIIIHGRGGGDAPPAPTPDTGVRTTLAGFGTLETGWTLNSVAWRVRGNMGTFQASVVRTVAITVGTSGNITNVDLISGITPAYLPAYLSSIGPGTTGPLLNWAIVKADAAITMTAIAPGNTIAAGTGYNLGGVWMTET